MLLPKCMLPKASPQSVCSKMYSPKLLPMSKLLCQSCRAKLLLPPKAVSRKAFPKVVIEKLLRNSCILQAANPVNLFPKAECPKCLFLNATPQSCTYVSKTVTICPISCDVFERVHVAMEKNQHQNVFPPHFPWRQRPPFVRPRPCLKRKAQNRVPL